MPTDKASPQPEDEKFERWTAQRKASIILEVLKGQISVPEAARKYGFTQGEYRKWAEEYHRGGLEALKVNRKDEAAKYRAEVKRLQAKIGQLVMDDEIRQEAMRPFLSGDQTSSVWSPRAKERVKESVDS
jgi:transposase-like protein